MFLPYLADLSVQLVYMLSKELTKPQDNQLEYWRQIQLQSQLNLPYVRHSAGVSRFLSGAVKRSQNN